MRPLPPMGEQFGWKDGLPWSQRFQDHYYSRDDGLAESRYVFLQGNRLPDRWYNRSTFTVGELGFGTGLNVLAVWDLWRASRREGRRLAIHSVEAYPLTATEAQTALAQWPELSTRAEVLISKWPDLRSGAIALDGQTDLHVHHGYAAERLSDFPDDVDAWFLDGFAPDRNHDMWDATTLSMVATRTVAGGTFATYTAAGWVRRNLEAAGFAVKRVPGFRSKRHMTVGEKQP